MIFSFLSSFEDNNIISDIPIRNIETNELVQL
jgi:hypothetical protein